MISKNQKRGDFLKPPHIHQTADVVSKPKTRHLMTNVISVSRKLHWHLPAVIYLKRLLSSTPFFLEKKVFLIHPWEHTYSLNATHGTVVWSIRILNELLNMCCFFALFYQLKCKDFARRRPTSPHSILLYACYCFAIQDAIKRYNVNTSYLSFPLITFSHLHNW